MAFLWTNHQNNQLNTILKFKSHCLNNYNKIVNFFLKNSIAFSAGIAAAGEAAG